MRFSHFSDHSRPLDPARHITLCRSELLGGTWGLLYPEFGITRGNPSGNTDRYWGFGWDHDSSILLAYLERAQVQQRYRYRGVRVEADIPREG